MGLPNFNRASAMLTDNQTIPGGGGTIFAESLHENKFIGRVSYVTAWVYLLGTIAGQKKAVEYYFERSPDNIFWFKVPVQKVVLNGDVQVNTADAAIELDIRSTPYFRLFQVINPNGGDVITNVEYTAQRMAGQA